MSWAIRVSPLIPLREELKFIGEYLDLEKMRFRARLTVAYHIAPDTNEILVPQLILQFLVENAIRHGIDCSREGGWVEISSQKERNVLELWVRNSIGTSKPHGTGVGLRNRQARLRHLYSDEASLSFVVGGDEVATTTLRLPALGSKGTDDGSNSAGSRKGACTR